MNKHHVTASIEGALLLSDEELQSMFGGFGPDIRHELEDRKQNGELLIGSVDCEGFDPIKGCPGHEVKEVTNV